MGTVLPKAWPPMIHAIQDQEGQFNGGSFDADLFCYPCPALPLYHMPRILQGVALKLLDSGIAMRWASDIQGCLMPSSI